MKINNQKLKYLQSNGRRRRQSGVGLIEVLIAVLVLAVGVLGLAQMQLSAKRASFEASQRSLALSLARDILERIRSNPSEAATYAAAATDLGVDAYSGTAGTDCSSVACTTTQLADYDMWDWISSIKGDQIKLGTVAAGGLLNAFVCIENTRKVDNSGDTVEVIIAWKGVNEIDQTLLNLGNTCGDGNFDGSGGADELRRQLNMTTFVSDA